MNAQNIPGTWYSPTYRFKRHLNHPWTVAPAGNGVTFRADGSWSVTDGSSSGTWRLCGEDELWLDAGTVQERVYRISWPGEEMVRLGPYRADGSWFSNLLFVFKDRRVQAVAPQFQAALPSPAPRSLPPPQLEVSGRVATEDWRDSAHEEWERTGTWTRWLGGCIASSHRNPDDWEHPHLK